MYRRIEVLIGDDWWGPMSALQWVSIPASVRFAIYDIWDELSGASVFGADVRNQCRFAWTQVGWETLGVRTLAVCQDAFGSENVRVRHVTGEVAYEDELQVALRGMKETCDVG